MTEEPKLTLAPAIVEEQTIAVKEKEQGLDETLTPEERQMVEDFARQIDIKNSTMVMQYGAGTQQKMASFSEKALEAVSSKELGDVGEMLKGMTEQLKGFDATEEKGGFFSKLFKKGANQIDRLRGKYDEVAANVDEITRQLEKHQIQLYKDVSSLDQLYESNKVYFKEISMYILAGKKSLEDFRAGELNRAVVKAEQSGLPEDAHYASDLSAKAESFEKKLYDLELTRNISLQTAPQIRLIQNNNTVMAEKIQSTIVNTIPLWKNQMVLALGIAHSANAAAAQKAVTDMTNDMLKKNAELLKQSTVAIAKENERGIVDIETLKETNATLISTIDEVLTIQADGREKRIAAEKELAQIESELKGKLLEISRK